MNIRINKLENLYNNTYYTPTDKIKENINKFIDNIYKNIDNDVLENDIYIGNVINNEIKGEGILLLKNKILINGSFNSVNIIKNISSYLENNISDNFNKISLVGDIVNGELVYGVINYDNTVIEGEFVNGLPNNRCLYKEKNLVYEGEWCNGVVNGFGFYKDNNITYEGEWINNKFHGEGKLIEINGIYDGCFNDGKKHGKGILTKNNEKFYVEYNNDNEVVKLDLNEKKILDLEDLTKQQDLEIKNSNNIIKQQENEILEYNNKLKDLEKQKKNIEEIFLCKVCFNALPNILLKPCNHLSLCSSCEPKVRNQNQYPSCPICRKKYLQTVEIFIC